MAKGIRGSPSYSKLILENEPKEKAGGELNGSETIIGEGESRDIKRDDPDNKVHGDTKGVDEVEEEIEESEEEVEEEEEEEEDDPKYFDTIPNIEELDITNGF
ncbi:hypothetical protein Tco_0455741 [Tanacetum coccineum]